MIPPLVLANPEQKVPTIYYCVWLDSKHAACAGAGLTDEVVRKKSSKRQAGRANSCDTMDNVKWRVEVGVSRCI